MFHFEVRKQKITSLKCSWEITFPAWRENIKVTYEFIHRTPTGLLDSFLAVRRAACSQQCTHVKGGSVPGYVTTSDQLYL